MGAVKKSVVDGCDVGRIGSRLGGIGNWFLGRYKRDDRHTVANVLGEVCFPSRVLCYDARF